MPNDDNGFSAFLPFDLQQQNQQAQRQRAIADALQQRALQPQQGQMVSGHYVSPGAGGALGQIAQALLANYSNKSANDQTAAIGQQYQDRSKAETGDFLSKYLGKPGQTLDTSQAGALMNNDQAPPPLADPVQADPKAAVIQAMTSQLPEMRGMGKAMLPGLLKGEEWKSEIAPNGAVLQTNARGAIRDGAPAGSYIKPEDKYSDPYSIPGGQGRERILVRRNLTTNKTEPVDTGSKVNVTNTLNGTPDDFGLKQSLEAGNKRLGEVTNEGQAGLEARDSGKRLLDLASDPSVITGFGANQVLGLQSLAAKLGFTGSDAVSKTQALLSEAAKSTLAASTKLKGAISDKEGPFLRQAAAGDITYTPETLQHLAKLAITMGHNQYMASVKDYNSIGSVEGMGNLMKMYPFPSANEFNVPEGISDDNQGRFHMNSSVPTPQRSGQPAGQAQRTAVNPQTGEKLVLQNGQWVPSK